MFFTATHTEYFKVLIPKLIVPVYHRNKNRKVNNTIGFKKNQGISERNRTRREESYGNSGTSISLVRPKNLSEQPEYNSAYVSVPRPSLPLPAKA